MGSLLAPHFLCAAAGVLSVLLQVFLQTKALGHDDLGMIAAHIAVVPGLVADLGNVHLILGIAQDKAVLGAVFLQPRKLAGVFEAFLQRAQVCRVS